MGLRYLRFDLWHGDFLQTQPEGKSPLVGGINLLSSGSNATWDGVDPKPELVFWTIWWCSSNASRDKNAGNHNFDGKNKSFFWFSPTIYWLWKLNFGLPGVLTGAGQTLLGTNILQRSLSEWRVKQNQRNEAITRMTGQGPCGWNGQQPTLERYDHCFFWLCRSLETKKR